jgi:hypothetical protein
MGIFGSRLELRVKLNPDKPWMVFQLDNLYKNFIWRYPRKDESRLFKLFSKGVVDLEPMTVPLADLRFAVYLSNF